METHVVRELTGKLSDINLLEQLYNLYEQHLNIYEIKYLKDFSMLETLETDNPRNIIWNTLIIYIRNVVNISCQPNLLQKFIFTYNAGSKSVYKFRFSNNMNFSHDITTLCFLYHISYKHDFDQCEAIQTLKSLMFSKYGICIERRENDTELHTDTEKEKITLNDIAFSFPSVTWDIACNTGLWTKFFEKFSDFNLPKIIFTPKIFSLLPQLKERPPLAILLVVILRINKFIKTEMYERLSLRTICNDISLFYENKIFPERLKLELCEKWQIVMIENGIYKYAPCFTAYRQRAKDIIAKMKPDDPDLEFILSKL